MTETTGALATIEEAQTRMPHCSACAAPNTTVADAKGAVWLQCSTLSEQKSTLRRLLSLDYLAAHTRQLLVEAPALEQVA